MKKQLTKNLLALSIPVLLGVSSGWNVARANDADRAYLKGKLSFFYVANPNAAGAVAALVDVDALLKNTGTGSFYTDPNMAKFRDAIKAMMGAGPVAGAGDLDTLQRVVASTLKLTGKPIGIYLIDDSAGKLTNSANINRFAIRLDGPTNQKVWPSASVYRGDDRDKHAWGGSFTLGAWHYNNTPQFATLKKCIGTVCHELMHTQDLSDMRVHQFGAFYYGADKNHFITEATPDRALVYIEGIADFAEFSYNEDAAKEALNWFTNNDYMYVEQVAPPGATEPELFLYKKLQAAGIAELTPIPAYLANFASGYSFYQVRSLPASVIAQNEQTIATALHTQAFYTSFDNVMGAIKDINAGTFNTSTSAWAQLISRLCVRSLPPGRTVEQLGRAEYKEPKKYFLPLAICDYFTSFRSANKADFKAVFEDLPTIAPWVDAYFDSGARDTAKAAVNPNAPKDSDIANLTIALGIERPKPKP